MAMGCITNGKQMHTKLKFQSVFITEQVSRAENHRDDRLGNQLSTLNYLIR